MKPYIIHGIASVSTVAGKPYVDSQGDVISTAELQRAAHDFMANRGAAAGVMHMRGPQGEVIKVGRVVSSCVMTNKLQKALGIDLGGECWIVGVKITDPRVAKAVKSGQLAGFSIAGTGRRTPIEIEE